MELYNRSEEKRQAVLKFEELCSKLGKDEGFVEVSWSEYSFLLEHYGRRAPWWGWPVINGVTVVRRGFGK